MKNYEVIIIGGSYAGLAAALTLARSRRKVLILDSGRPCNKLTPSRITFLQRTGKAPAKLNRPHGKTLKVIRV